MGLLDNALATLSGVTMSASGPTQSGQSPLGVDFLSSLGSGDQQQPHGLLAAAMGLVQQNGGLTGVLDKFRQNGMAQHADLLGWRRREHGGFGGPGPTGARPVGHRSNRVEAWNLKRTGRFRDGADFAGIDQSSYTQRTGSGQSSGVALEGTGDVAWCEHMRNEHWPCSRTLKRG